MYRTLDAAKIIATLEQLESRIRERFPDSGLRKGCGELLEIARETDAQSARTPRPRVSLRVLLVVLMCAAAALLAYVGFRILANMRAGNDLSGPLQGIDSGFNILVLTGAILFFMWSIEERLKRGRILTELHKLRS